MTTKYGFFREEDKISTRLGDPYTDLLAVKDDRNKGLNMVAPVGKKGWKGAFDKHKSLYAGQKFVDPTRLKLQEKVKQKEQNVSEAPFKPAPPMKKSVTAGDFHGTFGKIKYEPGTVDVKKKKGEVEIPPKGIYTSVPKKGTFGMNKFTLSERQGYKGVATEYEYFHDPMPDSKKRLEALEEERKKRVTEAPFRAPGALANGYAGKNSIKVPPYVPQGEPIKPPAAEPVSDNAFKPPRVGKSGFFGAMNRYPEYQPDPEAGRIEAAKKARAEAREKLAAAGGGAAWRPSKGYKTVATPSILRMNI